MTIRPFAAVRPNAMDAALVASVPYDVLSQAEADVIKAANPKSFLNVSLPATPAEGRAVLDKFRSEGTLIKEDAPSFYAYRQIMGSHSQTGIVATFATADYRSGVIKQHEKTRKDKEDDRTHHIEVMGAQTGPAFLTYRDDPAIDLIVADTCRNTTPLYDFTADDGIRHTVWKIGTATACACDELVELFARIKTAFIADGHHRSAAATRYAAAHPESTESQYFLATIFPASQLKILAYNRLVKDLNGLTPAEFLAKLSQLGILDSESGSRSCRMYFEGKWHTLAWNLTTDDPVARLDVAYLQDHVLAPILGIGDPRTDKRISFVGGIRGDEALSSAVDSGSAAVAFAMNPVTVEEMMAIADAGAIMPPKSTWFEPKLRSGLFLHEV